MAKEKADIERTVASPPPPALSLRGLTVSYRAPDRELDLITGVSLDIGPGEIVCLVGESGSGKTLTGRAVLGLLRHLILEGRAQMQLVPCPRHRHV